MVEVDVEVVAVVVVLIIEISPDNRSWFSKGTYLFGVSTKKSIPLILAVQCGTLVSGIKALHEQEQYKTKPIHEGLNDIRFKFTFQKTLTIRCKSLMTNSLSGAKTGDSATLSCWWSTRLLVKLRGQRTESTVQSERKRMKTLFSVDLHSEIPLTVAKGILSMGIASNRMPLSGSVFVAPGEKLYSLPANPRWQHLMGTTADITL